MSAHIIGRPNDDLLEMIIGDDADPEQAIICGSEQARHRRSRNGSETIPRARVAGRGDRGSHWSS